MLTHTLVVLACLCACQAIIPHRRMMPAQMYRSSSYMSARRPSPFQAIPSDFRRSMTFMRRPIFYSSRRHHFTSGRFGGGRFRYRDYDYDGGDRYDRYDRYDDRRDRYDWDSFIGYPRRSRDRDYGDYDGYDGGYGRSYRSYSGRRGSFGGAFTSAVGPSVSFIGRGVVYPQLPAHSRNFYGNRYTGRIGRSFRRGSYYGDDDDD